MKNKIFDCSQESIGFYRDELRCTFDELLNLYEVAELNPEKLSGKLENFVQGGLRREDSVGGTGGGVEIILDEMDRKEMIDYFKELKYRWETYIDANSNYHYNEKNPEPVVLESDFIRTYLIVNLGKAEDCIQIIKRSGWQEDFPHYEIRAGFSRRCTLDTLKYLKEKNLNKNILNLMSTSTLSSHPKIEGERIYHYVKLEELKNERKI